MQVTSTNSAVGSDIAELPESLLDSFTGAFICFARIDSQGCYLSVNADYAEVCGYQQAEMIGMSWQETVHADDRELAVQKYKEMLNRGRAEAELRGVRRNQSVYYKQILMVKGLESDDSSVQFYCFMNDITGRLLDELMVLRSVKSGLELQEQQFHQLIKDIPGVIYRRQATTQWSFDYLSSGIEKLLGIPAYQLLASGSVDYADLIHVSDRQKVEKLVAAAIAEKRGFTVEYRIRNAAGRTLWFRERATISAEESEATFRIGGIIRDISDSKTTEKQLQIAQHLVDGADDAIFWFDEYGRFVYANDSACAVLGYDSNSLLTFKADDVLCRLTAIDGDKATPGLTAFTGQAGSFETLVRTDEQADIRLAVSYRKVEIVGNTYTCVHAKDVTVSSQENLSRHAYQTISELLSANTPQELIRETLCELLTSAIPGAVIALFSASEDARYQVLTTTPGMHHALAVTLTDAVPQMLASCNAGDGAEPVRNFSNNSVWQNLPFVKQAEIKPACWMMTDYGKVNALHSVLVVVLESGRLLTDFEHEFLQNLKALTGLVVGVGSKEEQLQRFDKIVESADDIILYVDRDYHYRVVSDKYAVLHGMRKEDVLGKFYPDVVGRKRFYEIAKAYLDRSFAGEHFELRDWIEHFRDGRAFYHLKLDPVREDGQVVGVVIIMRDITQLYKVGEALRETEDRYRKIVENSQDMMILTHLDDGRIITVNKAFTKVSGYAEEQVIGTQISSLYVNPDDRNALLALLEQDGSCTDFEMQMITRSKEIIPVILSCNLIEYDNERCIFTVVRNISEQKSAEAALAEKSRSLELLQKVTLAANQAIGVEAALQVVVDEICEFCDWPLGHAYLLNDESGELESSQIWHNNEHINFDYFRGISEKITFTRGLGMPGRVLESKDSVWVEKVSDESNFPRAFTGKDCGITSAFALPVFVEDKVVAVLEFFHSALYARDDRLLELLEPTGVLAGRVFERKQADEALKQSRVNFRKAVNASPDSIIITRLDDGRILDVNDAVLAASAYSRDELIDKGIGMMFWADENACKEHVRAVRRNGRVSNHSMLSRMKDGTTVPCLISSTLIDVNGSACVFSIVKDVSALTQAIERIRENEKQAGVITHSLSVYISYVDTELRYLFNNDELLQELGLGETTVEGKTIPEVMGRQRYREMEPFIAQALSGKDVRFELDFVDAGGQQRVYELTCHPDRKQDSVAGIYIVSSDITERRKEETILRKNNRALRVLSECGRVLVKEHKEYELLRAVCNIVIREGGYVAVWVSCVGREENEDLRKVVSAVQDKDADIRTAGTTTPQLYKDLAEEVMTTASPGLVRSADVLSLARPADNDGLPLESTLVLGLPLNFRGVPLGAILISSLEMEAFDTEEIRLLGSMAENLAFGLQAIRETAKRKKAEALLALENHAFQLLATMPVLPDLLENLLGNIEEKLSDKYCSILLLGDNGQLSDGASPRINVEYLDQVLRPAAGSPHSLCAQAVQTKLRIQIADTGTDAYWQDKAAVEYAHGYLSCCITPILTTDDRVLGTFTTYSKKAGNPDQYELQIIDRMSYIIGSAIESYKREQSLKVNEERLALAMKGSQDGLWDFNLETNESYWSPRWKSMLGYEDHELESSLAGFIELLHPDNKDVHEKIISEVQDNFEIDFKMKHKDGHYIDILSRSTGLRATAGGKVTRIVGTHVDLTERNRAARRLRESERQLQTLYDDSPSMFFTLDGSGSVLSINKFGAAHLGYSVASLMGVSILELVHQEDDAAFTQKLTACFAGQRNNIQKCEVRIMHKYGDILWVRATMRASGLENDSHNILVTCEDISEARILSEQLEYQARHDALTGLINRVEFEKRLRRLLNQEADDSEHALCYLDLDQFKVINDTCGHLAGDELLRRISDILNTVVRKRDTLARMGGDEFAVLLEHCPLEQARRVAQELLRSVETLRFVWEGKRFVLGVSIGLVPMRAGSGTLSDILGAADEACYAAKDAGRNRIHTYYSDDVELSRRRGEMEWVSRINHALEDDLFCLDMQAIDSLSDAGGKKAGAHYELLLRMQDDDGQLIYPGAFLPAAERYNLSEKIDRWVVSRTLQWLSADEQELEGLAVCSINLSGHSMGDEDFLSFLLAQFGQNTVPPEKVCFEITETAAIANLGAAIQFINALKGIGCLFALDDFGTGVSSFNYLKNLPVDYLKIDGSFIREIHKDPIDFAMVRSINEIGQVMGKETIAEFVENKAILKVVRGMGINFAQGYATGKPVAVRLLNRTTGKGRKK